MRVMNHPSTFQRSPRGHALVGTALREWRTRRRLSQMELALDVGVSTRHLSFIETGRSRPSAPMLLALAQRLDVPLRERNRLLLGAGYAPQFGEQSLAAPEMQAVTDALHRVLDAHDPYPGLIFDRGWNVVLANAAAQQMMHMLAPELRTPPVNILRASLHPQGFARYTLNFADWAWSLLDSVAHVRQQTGDARVAQLEAEVRAYPNVQALLQAPRPTLSAPAVVLPCEMDFGQGRLSLFTTVSTLGTPQDITLSELAMELFYPADGPSRQRLEASAAAVRQSGDKDRREPSRSIAANLSASSGGLNR